VGGGALHAPPALLRGAPPLFDSFFRKILEDLENINLISKIGFSCARSLFHA